jgi:hypothetical protein
MQAELKIFKIDLRLMKIQKMLCLENIKMKLQSLDNNLWLYNQV